jgi:hypothetical protein
MSPVGTEVALVKLETWVTFGYRNLRDKDYYFLLPVISTFLCRASSILCFGTSCFTEWYQYVPYK